MAVSLLASGLVALAIWEFSPRGLRPPINIVGHPTFANIDFHPAFLKYRLFVWVVPAVSVAIFAVLWRWGPLAGPRPDPRPEAAADTASSDRSAGDEWVASPARVALVLPAAAALTIAVSARNAPVSGAVTETGLLVGLGYVAMVLLVGSVVAAARRREHPGRRAWLESVAQVNGPAAAIAAAMAVCVFARTTATVTTSGDVQGWPWVPGWAAVGLVVAAAAWAVGSTLAGVTAAVVERRAVGILGGSALVFIVTSRLPGPIGPLQGFDDMQSVTGADLLNRGFFPWRDVTFVHGVFEDALRSWAGFALFDHTLWGTNAAMVALWAPLGWVALFLFAVWSARGRWLPLLCVSAMLIWAIQFPLPLRWWFAPIVWILLGEALRRSRTRWTMLMTSALFVEAVLVPEAAFQVLAVFAVVMLHDLTARSPSTPWWRGLRTTRDAAVTGAVLTVLWCGFLALHHSLRHFVDYYRIFAPGHVETGALPFGPRASDFYTSYFLGTTCLVAFTLLVVGWVLVSRRPVSVRLWLMLATALMAGMYGEKALGRFDDGHLAQSIEMAFPLAILWMSAALLWADEWVQSRWAASAKDSRRRLRAPLASLVALAAIVVGFPTIRTHVWHAPSGNKAFVLDESLPLLGYSTPETYDPDLLADLGTVVDELDGRDGGFFDFTNGLGWFYYLLDIDPSTSYFHVSMAVPEFAQEDLVEQLEKDPPALVAFDGPIGMPVWDGVSNEIRHFDVSQYLLDGWTPVLSTHGVVFMLRNDLVADGPALPALTEVPRTTDLYFAAPPCDWGFVPNYLESPTQGRSVAVDVDPAVPASRVDLQGWSIDPTPGAPPPRILVALGSQVLVTTSVGVPRPDVAAAMDYPGAATSGYAIQMMAPRAAQLRLYAEYADGMAYPLTEGGTRVDSLTLPDEGRTVDVADTRAMGALDVSVALRGRLSTVDVPAEVSLPDVSTMTFARDASRLGLGDVLLTDDLTGSGGNRSIQFRTLPVGGESVSVRVGSCLQWHGFGGDQLYLFRRHGRDIRQVTFSGLPQA
jgi:hypothetical protein